MSEFDTDSTLLRFFDTSEPLQVHYFDLANHSGGDYISVFLTDAGIPFEVVKHEIDQPLPRDAAEGEGGNAPGASHSDQLPVIHAGSRRLRHSIPTLRYLARRLNRYHATSPEDEYLAELVGDINNDCFSDYFYQFRQGTDESAEAFVSEGLPRYLQSLQRHYEDRASVGPYLLGEEPIYSDFVTFCGLNEYQDLYGSTGLLNYPRLRAMYTAMEKRPRISLFLSSRKTDEEVDH